MGNNLTASIVVRGTRPLLWHCFSPDTLPLGKKERSGVAGNDPEEWRKTILVADNRQLYIRSSYVFACVREGAKYTLRKRGPLQPLVAATLQVLDDIILTDRFLPDEPIPTDTTLPVYLDIQSVRNPTTKARNIRYRIAASSRWQLTFNLMWDRTIVSRNELEAVVIDAGRFVGLGDGRSIGYGRFEVISSEVHDA